MTNETDLIAYLQSKGETVNRASGREVTIHCLWCPDGDPKGKGKLYLNTDSWLYSCKRCDERGNRKTLLDFFGDEDETVYAAGSDPMLNRKLLQAAADMAHEMLLANKGKLAYLLERGIDQSLIIKHKLGYVPQNVGVAEMVKHNLDIKGYEALMAAGLVTLHGREFLNDCITIPYFSHGSVVQIRAKFIDGKYLTAGGDNVRLYNADSLYGADEVLITEGELDALAVETQLMKAPEGMARMAVVGLAGANSWPEGFEQMLADKKKIFIGLDPDDTGKKGAAKLKEEIAGSRGRIIELPDTLPKTDWTDYFKPKTDKNPNGGHDWLDLQQLITEADMLGKTLFNVADLSSKWTRRKTEQPGLKLGWASLDAVLRPGLRPGQVMIPLAKSGTGKTVWLSNVAYNLRKRRVLFVSLELTGPEVYEHLYRIHFFWNPTQTRDHMLQDMPYLRVTDQNRIGPGDLGALVKEYTEDVGEPPELLIIDYLQYYARGFRGASSYERVNDAMMEVKAVSKEESLATIIPSQVNRGAEHGKPISADDARDSGVIDETGDFVIALFRPDQVVEKGGDGQMQQQSGVFLAQLLKSRHGGKGKRFELRLSLMSLAIVDANFDKQHATWVDTENSIYRRGIHYEDYRKTQDDAISSRPLWKDEPPL